VSEKVTFCRHRAQGSAKVAKDKVVEVASDRSMQVAAASAAGGAVVGGTGGALAGLFVGGTIGAAVGIIPAFLTFGLSIPLGAALGSGCGVAVGGLAGGATGMAGAGAAGYGAYTKRQEIGDAVNQAQTKGVEVLGRTKSEVEGRTAAAKARAVGAYTTAMEHCTSHMTKTSEKAASVCGVAKERVTQALETTKAKTLEIASDRSVQVAAASATGGAVAMGAGGAATGLVTGGAIGAAVGVVPAIFTFGLSIPVCAMVGGSCGLVTGSAVGGTAGLVGGGATGYGVYTKREVISSSVSKTMSRVDDCAKYMKDAASSSADYVRARVVSGTGGTTH